MLLVISAIASIIVITIIVSLVSNTMKSALGEEETKRIQKDVSIAVWKIIGLIAFFIIMILIAINY